MAAAGTQRGGQAAREVWPQRTLDKARAARGTAPAGQQRIERLLLAPHHLACIHLEKLLQRK